VTGFALIAIILWGCKDELSKTGLGILPTGDLVSARKAILNKGSIKAYTVTDELQRTDETTNNLLGTFNDPVFGKTIVDFAFQLRLPSFPNFKKNDIIDSLVLYVAYKELYGDTITPQKLKVYELGSDLVFDDKYYQDVNLKSLAKNEVLADFNYIPKFRRDSLTNLYASTKKYPKDTVTQEIAIHLDQSLAKKLMATDSVTLSDNELFIKHFKGLYVESGDLNQGGTIMKTLGSGLVLYYRKDNDTTKYVYNFKISKNAARVNRFYHDYSKTAFATNLDKKGNQDSLIYLQTTGGLASRILIPNLDNWRDSANIAINKAELIFHVDQTFTDTAKYLPPYQVILSAITKSVVTNNDSLYFPSDLSFSQAYFGGIYNMADGTYRFNIAKHMQELISKKKDNSGYLRDNYGFYLSTADRNKTFGRVVLKGATSKTGIQVEITYSKIK